jgi:DNA-binding transcriptional LysR family regulator
MELRHFRYVIAVAEELNFGRAAERLNMSQPPLSHQIRMLEEELGVKLFERTKRRVQLTEAGIRFVEAARNVLDQVDRAAKVVARRGKGDLGHLSIGMVWERAVMIESLRILGGRYPGVHVSLHRLPESQQIQGLMAGRLDVAFMIGTSPRDAALAYETLAWEPLIVAVPVAHHLASVDRVPLRALATESYIMFKRDRNPGLYDEIIAVCRNAGFSLKTNHEVDSVSGGLALVAAGVGVALVPTAAEDMHHDGVVFRHLEGRLPKMESVVVYRRGVPSNVLAIFLDIVRSISKKPFAGRRLRQGYLQKRERENVHGAKGRR